MIHSTGLVPECIKHTLSPKGSEQVTFGQIVTKSDSEVDSVRVKEKKVKVRKAKAAFIIKSYYYNKT